MDISVDYAFGSARYAPSDCAVCGGPGEAIAAGVPFFSHQGACARCGARGAPASPGPDAERDAVQRWNAMQNTINQWKRGAQEAIDLKAEVESLRQDAEAKDLRIAELERLARERQDGRRARPARAEHPSAVRSKPRA